MAQITPAGYEALYWAWNTQYQQAYFQAASFYEQFTSVMASKTKEEVYIWMDRLPSMRKWLGERFINNLQGRVYRLKNDKYEDTFAVQRDDIQDDENNYNMFGAKIQALAFAAKQWPDQLVANAIAAGITAPCFDGLPFFYNAHPNNPGSPGAGTYQNRYDSSANGGGVSYPLSAQSVVTISQNMRALKGADGAPLNVQPTHLIVPPQLEGIAKQILVLPFIAQAVGSNVAAMQSSVAQGWLQPIVNPFLTDPNRYYIVANNGPIRPFIFQLRDPQELTFLNKPTDPASFMRDEWLFGVRARGAAGYSLPFLAATGSI